jgi:hypothetical protein
MMKLKLKFIFSATLCIFVSQNLMVTNPVYAAEGFDYPELSVVPRASERLEMEAANEKNQTWQTHLPFLVPATMTALSGVVLAGAGTKSDVQSTNTSAQYAPWVGIGVGAAWWAVSLGILNKLNYYSDGLAEVSKLPAKSQREQLLRERRAEEAIQQAGSLVRRLKWISIVSNLGASGYLAVSAKDKSFSLYIAGASAVAAFTPLIFPHRWSRTEMLQRDYKKRIYAPIASLDEERIPQLSPTVLMDPNGLIFSPGLQLSLKF